MAEFNNIRTYTHEEKVECRKAIEKAIKDFSQDNKLFPDCAAKVIANFDNACIRSVLRMNIILNWKDEGFSKSNKKWGWITDWGCLVALELRRKHPECNEYIINHPSCLVNAFVDQFRELDNNK